MRLAILLITMVLVNCTSTQTTQENLKNSKQIWTLIKMTGSLANSETTGAEMPWQETIFLEEDGKLEKRRTRNGTIASAQGTYTFKALEDGDYLILNYEAGNDLIGNCTGNLTEIYRLESGKNLQGTWLACDGPGLEYERTN